MTISYNWLQRYLPVALPVEELCAILTSIGLEVEGTEVMETVKGGLKGLVIGEVLTCGPHPNADKLKLTTVNIGTDNPLSIVCGAANVAAGQKVVVATVGCTVHPINGASFEIKKAKIRGVESEGMLCAEDEIGLGESHAGIMVLSPDAVPGTPASVYFKLDDPDTAVYIGLTPNRSDAMSHIGVARDVCAYLTHHKGQPFSVILPEVDFPATEGLPSEIRIAIADDAQEACLRYAGVSIRDVRVGPSPDWLRQALHTIGVRSVNNIVDVTNYVLHEYGQPLHAFDQDHIAGNEINVRFLPEGTSFTTLDEKQRSLYAEDLMICDAEKGLCLAGVFGGKDSGVSDTTRNIFLESAYFSGPGVRRTSLRHGLRTDAATHFEKCVDINNVVPALRRAATLIAQVSGGVIATTLQDIYPKAFTAVQVSSTYEYIRTLSGKAYSDATILNILKALQFKIETVHEGGFTVSVPSSKNDITLPADLVEEILRIDGLDQVAIPSRLNISLTKALPSDRRAKERMAELLCGSGFQEIVTNSITNSRYYPEDTPMVRMINSLTSELDVLRPSMLESGLEVIQYNVNRKSQDLALFEFGAVYASSAPGKYQETPVLSLWVSGNVRPGTWSQPALPASLYYLKSVIGNMLRLSGISKATLQVESEDSLQWKWKNEVLCTATQVSKEQLKRFEMKQAVYFAAINWSLWAKAMQLSQIRYTEVPKYPSVQRDLALVLNQSTRYEEVQKVTNQLQIPFLKEYDLFDVFESEKLGAGKKSYAMTYTFQLTDRTLTDAEIDAAMQQLINTYQNKLEAQIRS